jgi:hypothetical protein
MANIVTPYISPYGYPNNFPGGQKNLTTKKVFLNNVLIPWYPISYLTIASSGFLFLGRLPYPTLQFGGAWDWGWGRSNKYTWSFEPAEMLQLFWSM